MDNLTHSLLGALIGQAGLKRKTGLGMPALIIGANIPDIDAACFLWLDGIEHVGFRRGITHGPPAMLLLPLMLAGLLWTFDKWQAKRGKRPEKRLPLHFGWLYALSLIGCLSHPALDWMNVYGVRLLEPFSSQWFYGDVLFIIDIWLWLGMGLAIWLSLRRERRGGNWRRPALAGLAATLVYIGANLAMSYIAVKSIPAPFSRKGDVIASPPPVAFWRRELILPGPPDTFSASPVRFEWDLLRGGLQPDYDIYENACDPGIDYEALERSGPDLRAFLFWSRAPMVRAENGWVLTDARFYNPISSGRFSVELPEGTCRNPPEAKSAGNS